MLGAVQERLPKISADGRFTYWAPWDVIGLTWRIQGSVGDKCSEKDASLADKLYTSLDHYWDTASSQGIISGVLEI